MQPPTSASHALEPTSFDTGCTCVSVCVCREGGPVTWRQVSWKELPYREHSWQHDPMMQVYGELAVGWQWAGSELAVGWEWAGSGLGVGWEWAGSELAVS